ncbi:MAG: penicillin amidase [Chitinophagales bacterium]|nr:MAG: penicillin amidase [Chitinophagales bacterium]
MKYRLFIAFAACGYLVCTPAWLWSNGIRDYAAHVTIVRDVWGVPHIFGETDADVAYGLAWASAEDNFRIVQETYLAARGMLGRVLGKDGAKMDFLQHLIGTDKLIGKLFESYSSQYVAYLEGFAAGLNDFARANPSRVLLEELFPLSALDISRAYFVSLALNSEVHRELKKIMDGEYTQAPTGIGSNAFAFSKKITKDDHTYLCINPHQPLEGHFSWYEAHLVSEEGMDVLGATFPGGASIYLGTNRNLGWAHTSNDLDAVDVYRLEMNPDRSLTYHYDGEWLPLEKRPVKLKVKLLGNIKVGIRKTTYWSVHGPVIKAKDGHYYALRYPANMEIRAPEQWYWMNKARNLDEFLAAVQINAMPKYHIIYADKEDNIFFIDNGMIPVRDTSLDWSGVMPGNTSRVVWNTWHPVDYLPQLLNPECGYVFNMNNTPFDATCEQEDIPSVYPKNMGLMYYNTNRSMRFMELLQEYPLVSFEDMKAIKYDVQFPDSSLFLSSLQNLFEMDEKKYPQISDVLRLVKQWDRRASSDCVACGVILPMFDYIFKKKHYGSEVFAKGMYEDESLYVEALTHARKFLLRHFGTTEVTLADIQRLRRGEKDLPMPGFPDALAAAYSRPAKDGRFVGWIGDSYTMFVAYDRNGPVRIETLHPYGSSSNPDSPHYTDQMELYVRQHPKSMTMDKDEIFRGARKIYQPKVDAPSSADAGR